jgi:hypothetical protein
MSQASAARPPLIWNENVKAEIRRSLTQSASAFNRGDVDTILETYAPDAVVLPPNSPAVQGIDSIRQSSIGEQSLLRLVVIMCKSPPSPARLM